MMDSCLVLEGVCHRGTVTMLWGDVKNFRELNSGIKVGRMYLLVLETSQV